MDVEIDPLSMLEQTMQIDENSVTSNDDDEDVVCLTDLNAGSEVVEVLDDSDEVSSRSALSNQKPTIVLGTMPNGAVVLDPDSNNISILVDPIQKQDQQSPLPIQQDVATDFGQHFLLNPGPSTYNDSNTSYPENCDSPPPRILPVPKVNGRGKIMRSRNVSRSNRGKAAPNRLFSFPKKTPANPNVNKINQNDSSASIGQKLVNNVKRLSCISQEEQTYRNRVYNDVQKVLRSRLDCTVCGVHIGCSVELSVFLVTHPLLKVLTCSLCREAYCNTDWTLGPENKDIRCRWCSFPANKKCVLKNCSNCPFAFCENCIIRNYSQRDACQIKVNPRWLCYVCQMVPLFYLRATCWALGLYIANISRRKNRNDYIKDTSICCRTTSTPINLIDDDAFESTEPVKTISTQGVSSRIEVMISSIETINHAVKLKLASSTLPVDKIEEFVSSLNVSLAKIGRNVESCLDYIENWRAFSLKKIKEEEKSVADKRECGPSKATPKRVNGSQDYSYLLKKFNIKPCRVMLERLEDPTQRHETSEPPNFFFSLLPRSSQEINIVEDDDDDDEIICLDD